MSDSEIMFFMGIGFCLFLPLLYAASHRLAIILFGEFKDKL